MSGLLAERVGTNENLQTCAAKLALAVVVAVKDPYRLKFSQHGQLFNELIVVSKEITAGIDKTSS